MDLAFRDRKSGDIWVRQEKMFYPFMNASVGGMRLKDEEAHARLDLVELVEPEQVISAEDHTEADRVCDVCGTKPAPYVGQDDDYGQQNLCGACAGYSLDEKGEPEPEPELEWRTDSVTLMRWTTHGDHIRLYMYPARGNEEPGHGRHVIEVAVPRHGGRLWYGYYREGPQGRWYNRGNGRIVFADAVLRRVSDALQGVEVPTIIERWVQEGP